MSYWAERSELEYYAVVRRLLDAMGPQPSILDVGCADTPCATWGRFASRYTIDRGNRPPLASVLPIVGSWPDCRALVPLPVSVVTCCQVLEHLDDPATAARELFAAASRAVVITVPWGWPSGLTDGHLHDPVDAAKLWTWTRRDPDKLTIVDHDAPRAVAVYYIEH